MIDRDLFKSNFVYLDKEVVIEIIDIFLSEFDERFSTIRKNIDDHDFTGLKFNAHSLKGVIANFMDPVTINLSKALDEKAKAEDFNGLQDLYEELKKSADQLSSELLELREEFNS